jgi:hypothetical protein
MVRQLSPGGLDIIESWQFLAEKRLAHLSELFETGRWRRYHTEAAFLENLREAESVVETWRMLAASEASGHRPDSSAIEQRYPLLHNALRRLAGSPHTALTSMPVGGGAPIAIR